MTISGPSHLCVGKRASYEATSIENAAYEWTLSDDTTARIVEGLGTKKVTLEGRKDGEVTLKVKASPPGKQPCTNTLGIKVRAVVTLNVCLTWDLSKDRHVPTPKEVDAVISRLNEIWGPCCIEFSLVKKFVAWKSYVDLGRVPDDCILGALYPLETFPEGAVGGTNGTNAQNEIAGGNSIFQGEKQGEKFTWNTQNVGKVWAHEIGHTLGVTPIDYECPDGSPKHGRNLFCKDYPSAGTFIEPGECELAYKNALALPEAMRTQKK